MYPRNLIVVDASTFVIHGVPGMSRKLADVIPIRLDKDLQVKLKRLADKHGRTRSDEMRAGLNHWTRLHQKPEQHVHLLAVLVVLLVSRIERKSGKRWLDDLVTALAIRQQIAQLIEHFGPPFNFTEQPEVPANLASTVGELIATLEGLRPVPGVPAVGEGVFRDQEMLSWIIRDLGSAGWERNQAWERNRAKRGK
jgi:hypothetical protein